MGEFLLLPLSFLLQRVDLLPVDPDGEGMSAIQHVLQLQTGGENVSRTILTGETEFQLWYPLHEVLTWCPTIPEPLLQVLE